MIQPSTCCPGPSSFGTCLPLCGPFGHFPLSFLCLAPLDFRAVPGLCLSSSTPPSHPTPRFCICCSIALLPLQNSDPSLRVIGLLVSVPCSDDKFLEGKCPAHSRPSINGEPVFFTCFPFPHCPAPLPAMPRSLFYAARGLPWLWVDQVWQPTPPEK